MAGKKVQVPTMGGLRKVIRTGDTTDVDATIAALRNQLASLTNVVNALAATLHPSGGGGGAPAGSLIPGPGLVGGGILVGPVALGLTGPLAIMIGDDGGGGDSDPGPPGVAGANGATGAGGPNGPAVFMAAADGEDGWHAVPGGQGPTGNPGASGVNGAAIFMTAVDGVDGDFVPGPIGPPGPAGSGAPGPAVFMIADDGVEGDPGPPGPAGASGGGGSSAFSGCRLRMVGSASTPGTDTAIPWDTEDYDTNNYHSLVTNPSRITVPTTGYYRVSAAVNFSANTFCYIKIRVNGTVNTSGIYLGNQTNQPRYLNTTTYFMTAGDYFEIVTFSSAGGSTQNTDGPCWAAVDFLGT